MRHALSISLVVLLALASGCNQRNDTAQGESGTAEVSAQAVNVTPERLGELGAKIRKTPERAKELLSEYGLNEKTFEAEIRKVTEDPEASKRYAAAYKKASA